MSNFYDYLDNNGDISFAQDPFNEVDNAIFSEITYINFDGIEAIKYGLVSIRKVRDLYFERHSREDVKSKINHIAVAPNLLDKLVESKRFKDMSLGFYENVLDEKTTSQFAAITIDLPKIVYIGFRGTDDTIVGWKENFYSSFLEQTESQKLSVEYTNNILEKYSYDKRIYLGGHSKGGNLARFAGIFCKEEYQNKISVIWDNDGPGFSREILEKQAYKNIKDKIYRILPQTSIVGLLMYNDVTPEIVKSYRPLILQHMMDSWEVDGNSFIREENLTNEAIFIEKTLTIWLEKIPYKDRKRVIDSVFSCIEKSGYLTFTELAYDKIEAFKKIKSQVDKIDSKDHELIEELFNRLIENSKDILKESIKAKISNINFNLPIKL